MTMFKVGVQLWPQRTTVADMRRAWEAADDMGVDSLWTWDHFFPIAGPPEGPHFEGWTLLAAMAATTTHARVGMLVSGNPYRNPDLLADMARTLDHISGGRAILGIGSGWFEKDHEEYGFEFGTAPERLRRLETALHRIHDRLARLDPPPIDMPILIGGGGETVTLRLVAQHARMWNTFGPVDNFAAKNAVLDDWCAKVGRDPAAIERTVAFRDPAEIDHAERYVAAGAQHLIFNCPHPFDLAPIEAMLAVARG